MVLQSFNVPDTWDKKGWNKTAIPQTSFTKTTFTFPGNKSNHEMTLTVDTPDACKHTQVDFYTEKGYDKIETLTGDDERNVIGVLFAATEECKEPTPEVETMVVCRLEDKKYPVTINKDDFNKKLHSTDAADCDKTPEAPEVPVTPEKPEVPNKPEVEVEETPQTPTELPETGMVSSLSSMLGAGTLTAAGYHYMRSRRQ